MSGVLRSGVLRLVQTSSAAKALLQNNLPAIQQACNISGKGIRLLEKKSRPKAYDYKNKNYTYWNALFDKTTHRFDENSKVNLIN